MKNEFSHSVNILILTLDFIDIKCILLHKTPLGQNHSINNTYVILNLDGCVPYIWRRCEILRKIAIRCVLSLCVVISHCQALATHHRVWMECSKEIGAGWYAASAAMSYTASMIKLKQCLRQNPLSHSKSSLKHFVMCTAN